MQKDRLRHKPAILALVSPVPRVRLEAVRVRGRVPVRTKVRVLDLGQRVSACSGVHCCAPTAPAVVVSVADL